MSNVYYCPEDCGLELLTEVDFGESYEFDMIIVVRELETGKKFYGEDAGCSCPTPFDDMKLEDMCPLNEHTYSELEALVKGKGGNLREVEEFMREARK